MEYTLTIKQFRELRTAQAEEGSANPVWQRLGREMGFAWDTVRPAVDKGPMFFTAEAIPDGEGNFHGEPKEPGEPLTIEFEVLRELLAEASGPPWVTCDLCGGLGRMLDDISRGLPVARQPICVKCKGRGRLINIGKAAAASTLMKRVGHLIDVTEAAHRLHDITSPAEDEHDVTPEEAANATTRILKASQVLVDLIDAHHAALRAGGGTPSAEEQPATGDSQREADELPK